MAKHTKDLKGYVQDMLAVETEFHASFRRQRDDEQIARHPDAHQLISRAEEVIDRHLNSLRECLQDLGGSESAMKNAVGGVLGAAAGLYNKIRSDESASRALRDDYTALSFGAVCYQMLHTTALAMNQQRTADVAIENLRDLPPLIMAISGLIPAVLIEELAHEHKVAPNSTVAEDAVRNTRAAWAEAPAPPTY